MEGVRQAEHEVNGAFKLCKEARGSHREGEIPKAGLVKHFDLHSHNAQASCLSVSLE